MKIRYGFVTNSSSSSFILNFKSKHQVMEELLKDGATRDMAAAINNRILLYGIKLSKKELEQQLRTGYTTEAEYSTFFRSLRDGGKWEDSSLTEQELAEVEAKVKADMEKVKDGTYTVLLDVSDHDEEGSTLEHHVLPQAAALVTCFNNH